MPEPEPLLHGDYEYLSEGYYACLSAELEGLEPIPTCADVLDAYVVPLALIRVEKAGLPIPTWYLSNEYFAPPAILYGVNPFARNHAVVLNQEQCEDAARSISRNGKFVMCCQEITHDAQLVEFEQVLGWTPDERFSDWAPALYSLFQLPLASVRLIGIGDRFYFSAIERLPRTRLSTAGQNYLAQTAP